MVIITGGIFWWLSQRSGKDTLKFDPKVHQLITPRYLDIQDNLVLAGKINASAQANLTFPNSGKLVWIGVKEGDIVKKWQAIASLDKQLLKKNLQTQFNNYRTSLSTFNDTQDTYKSTKEKLLITDTIQRILDRTQYSLDNSVINYEITDMAVREATLVSPISGVITNITVPVNGVNVTPLNASFSIVDPSTLYFQSEIDQEDIPQVSLGQKATISLDSFPNQDYPTQLSFIAFTPVLGQSSTVYELRFRFDQENRDLRYRLGMGGDVRITLDQANGALTLPTEAIYEDEKGPYVYQKNQTQHLLKKYLRLGIQTDTHTQILEGLSQNEAVVLKNSH